jgi:hypothetical protein
MIAKNEVRRIYVYMIAQKSSIVNAFLFFMQINRAFFRILVHSAQKPATPYRARVFLIFFSQTT